MGNLGTTNIMLGIIAAVTVLEGVGFMALVAVLVTIFSRVGRTLRRLEEQQLPPAVAHVNAILDDAQQVSSMVKEEAGRLHAVSSWIFNFVQHHRA